METMVLARENIIKKLRFVPESKLNEVDSFIQYIIFQYNNNSMNVISKKDSIQTHFASEMVLSEDWLSKEEEEAWESL